MKKIISLILLLQFALSGVAFSQSVTTEPIKRYTTLPATCSPTISGRILAYKTTDTGTPKGLYQCKTLNTWTLIGSDGAGISDGDKGDVTVSGSGANINLDNGAVTNAKIASGIDAAKITTGVVPSAQIPPLNASKVTIGTFHPARLGTGTASILTYLRGDGLWSTIPLGNTNYDSVSNHSNSLTTAISDIGATKKTLLLDVDVTVGSAIVIPTTLELLPTANGAKITKSGSATINCQGNCLVNPLSTKAVFYGFAAGDITFSGTDYPRELSTEVFDTNNDSLTDRVKIADAALLGKTAKIVAHPRTITSSATITSNHTVFFSDGDYPNTLNTFGVTFLPPFLLKDNTTLQGQSWNARLHESPHNGSNYFAQAYHVRYDGGETGKYNSNIIVENLSFIGDELQYDTSSGNGFIYLGNSHYSEIRYCKFDRVHGYTATFGSYGTEGNFAFNSKIHHNLFIGMGSQLANFLNAESCEITDNKFDQTRTNNNSTYAIIDLEPNTGFDHLSRVTVARNIIDLTGEVRSQSEYVDIAGTSAATGSITTTITASGLTGSPVAVTTNIAAGDAAKIVAQKIKNTINANPTLAAFGFAYIDGPRLKFAKVVSEANDATYNIAVGSASGIAAIAVSSDATKYAYGIAVQAASARNAGAIFVENNTIIAREIDGTPYGSPLLTGIGIGGVNSAVVKNNYVRGAQNGAFAISNSRYVEMSDNVGILNDDSSGQHLSVSVIGVAASIFKNNTFSTDFSSSPQGTKILEAELDTPAVSTGSTITLSYDSFMLPYQWWTGLKVEFNGVDYTVQSTASNLTLTTTVAVGTVTAKSVAASAVDSATDAITAPSHNFQTGARLELFSTGTLPAHSAPALTFFTNSVIYSVIVVDSNTIKLASSKANALAGIAIDLTSAGTGTHTLSPALVTKFSSSSYNNNKTPDGIFLEQYGASFIASTYDDKTVTSIADANFTAVNNSGLILYTSLTAPRTVNLPTASGLKGKEIQIKDGAGTAGTNNITIDGFGSETIDGAATLVINANRATRRIKSDGANWLVIQ